MKLTPPRRFVVVLGTLFAALTLGTGSAQAVTLDFETDDGGNALINGQSIYSFARPDGQGVAFSTDNVQEFGNLVNVFSVVAGSGPGHLGPAIFDSNPGGPNAGGNDPDLLVDSGNILILQNNGFNATDPIGANGLVFSTPDDEANYANRGTIIFEFLNPQGLTSSPQSIDLIDINGLNEVFVRLVDSGGRSREWRVDEDFTGPGAIDTLNLTVLAPQAGAGGGLATLVLDQAGFDPLDVDRLGVFFSSNIEAGAISGGLDNLVFAQIPVPPALLLFGSALAWLIGWLKRG